jgi:hypothetical protein
MTTDMGRDMAGDMARGLGTVCWGVGCSPDTMLSSHFFGFLSFWANRFWLGLVRDDLGQVGLVGKQTG